MAGLMLLSKIVVSAVLRSENMSLCFLSEINI